MFPEAFGLSRSKRRPVTLLISITVFDKVNRFIVGYDVYNLCIKDLPYLFSNEFVDALYIDSCHKTFLYTIDHSKLCVALFRFFQQPVSFVKQPCICQCDTHTVSQGFQQADIAFAECSFLINILQTYITLNLIPGN